MWSVHLRNTALLANRPKAGACEGTATTETQLRAARGPVLPTDEAVNTCHGKRSASRSCALQLRAILRCVSLKGHSHAVSMWQWPTAYTCGRGVQWGLVTGGLTAER